MHDREKAPNEKKIKKKTKKSKSDRKLYTYRSMQRELDRMKRSYTKKQTTIMYLAMCALAIVSGLLFQLNLSLIIIIVIIYALFVPQIILLHKREEYELERFQTCNSYMSQMATSFAGNQKLLTSLKETARTFPTGKLHEILEEGIDSIVNSRDVKKAETDLLKTIEKEYECERIIVLHDFMIKSELRGGDCKTEFGLLEKVRLTWYKNMEKYRSAVKVAKTMAIIEYIILMFICNFLVKSFPESMSIIHTAPTQYLNCFLIIGLLAVYIALSKKTAKSLLENESNLSKETIDKNFDFINNYDGKAFRKRNIPKAVMLTIAISLLIFIEPSVMLFICAIGFGLLLLNIDNLKFYLTVNVTKQHITKTFPKWLFDVLLLLQHNSIFKSIELSYNVAPLILKPALEKLIEDIKQNPDNIEPYLRFLEEYKIPGVEDTMRSIYSINEGTNKTPKEKLQDLIEVNMSLLSNAEKERIKRKEETTSAYYLYPFPPCIIAMLGYCVILVITVLEKFVIAI